MVKRLQVLLDEDEYGEFQETAQRQQMSLDAWVLQALRQARRGGTDTTAAKLTALTNASKHEFPAGDIGEMLHDIAAGQRLA